MLGPPGALQGFGDLLFPVFTPPVTECGEGDRVAFPGQDGLDNRHARDTSDIADHFGELHVHLLKGFLHRKFPPEKRQKGRIFRELERDWGAICSHYKNYIYLVYLRDL